MKYRLAVFICLLVFFLCVFEPAPAAADSSHARIVRLSLIQGDVRFAREFHKDALDDSKASWEVAPLNLPIRQGYAVATDGNGRAEVEFENGAMAFLAPNTEIEFYDLSLEDGALITRLVLRQGSAIFYVHPAKEDFFSVTGGDFSVEANGRTRFRLDNYDDGSTLNVEQGHVSVLRGKQTKALEQGQSYAINVNDGGNPLIGRNQDSDDFDKWVSGRIDNVATATTYASQYVNSPSYSSGFADLYNYGSWYNIAGYGYGWQPYGVGLGWCPFAYGGWYYDPFFGYNFIGSAPWGWLPYHYGGWILSPVYGWVWVPTGFGVGGPVHYRPITAVWVHSGGVTGLVPVHPADLHGKPPLNLNQGVYAVHGNTLATNALPTAGEKWSVLNHPAREVLTPTAWATAPTPTRVSRTILSGRPVTVSRDSSIVYEAGQHRFVNSNEPPKASREEAKTVAPANPTKESVVSAGAGGPPAKPNAPAVPRASVSRPSVTPPSPTHTAHSSGGAVWSGSGSGSHGGAIASSHASTGSSHGSGGHH
jgi:hypothetical protein